MGKIWDEYIAFTPQGKEKAPRFLAWLFDRMWEAREVDQKLSDPKSVRLIASEPLQLERYGTATDGMPPPGKCYILDFHDDEKGILMSVDIRSLLSFPEIMLSDRAQPGHAQLPWQLPEEES